MYQSSRKVKRKIPYTYRATVRINLNEFYEKWSFQCYSCVFKYWLPTKYWFPPNDWHKTNFCKSFEPLEMTFHKYPEPLIPFSNFGGWICKFGEVGEVWGHWGIQNWTGTKRAPPSDLQVLLIPRVASFGSNFWMQNRFPPPPWVVSSSPDWSSRKSCSQSCASAWSESKLKSAQHPAWDIPPFWIVNHTV